jgi:hypothetical protein
MRRGGGPLRCFIQYNIVGSAGWTVRVDVLYDRRVPTVDLTPDELRDAAMAARAAAYRAQQDAAAQPNPRISATFAADADRYARLSDTFERARHAPVAR